ncbi:MAG TPA: family 43 glycosylhydrolase [Candidatus Sulfopaludibacter sp.]|nr:family 43 glycosylhydrolase [Candidatus Sulfopaludibacter sp.]
MKIKNLYYVASAFLAAFLVYGASGQDSHWSGLGGDGLWGDPNNWNPVGVPASTVDANVWLDSANGWSVMTITNGEMESPGSGSSDMIYGPEFGAGLNIYGTLNWRNYLVPVQNDPTHPSIVNLFNGSSVSGTGLALGDTWWYWGGPYATLNLYGNAFAGINYMYWGGHVNLYGGILNITNGLTLDTIDSVSDATRSMNLAGGELILPNAFGSTINNWISRGILLAYGKALDNPDIVINTTSLPGRTIVTTVPLGGSLQDIHLQSFPTNLTTGMSQSLTVLGDYPNVQNAVLTALDPATLPGTIAYQSSNPNVAVIDTNGLVTAAAAGNSTLTATLGAFASTNSIAITVGPNTNLMPRLPEEQPLWGYDYMHDPGTMIYDGVHYYVFGDGQGVGVIDSTDMRNWNYANPVFPGNPPPWTTNSVPGFTGYFWAPDEAYFNGRYNIYYACSIWGTINSAIGLVTTPSLIAPTWTDQGKVIQSNPVGQTNATTDLTAYNCIDPSIMVDTNGTVWMSFGSYSDGILIMQLDPSTGKRISANSPIYRVSNNGPTFFSSTEEGSYLYQHGGYYFLFVNFGGCCDGINSTYNIRVGRSTSVTGPYYDRAGVNMTNGGGTMFLESSGRFIGPGHAAILNLNGTNWFTYHYYDGNNGGTATLGIGGLNWSGDGWPVFTNDWSAFYPFNADASDAGGLYNGALESGAVITNEPGFGSVLSLNGSSQYALLPIPVANASTFATWVKWNGGAAWQRIFDFGTDTTNYLFLTPKANSGGMRFAITTNGNGAEQQINAPFALPTNSWCHVAVTLDGSTGLLYLNGIPVATNNNLTIRPWQTLAKTNYIGHSQFPADPLFGGEISSFRIFGRALSGAEIKDLAYAPPALAHRYSFTSNTSNVVWDSIGMAHGMLQGHAAITNNALQLTGVYGDYVNLPGGLASGASTATIEFWANFGSNGSGAQLFDLGDSSNAVGQNYLSFSPHTVSSTAQLGLVTTAGTLNLTTPGIFDNQALQVDCILDPLNGYDAIYTNGILLTAVTNTTPPLSSVSSAWSFIGRSLFGTDAWLDAAIDEFRIYDGRLTPAQLAANNLAGPNALTLPINLSMSAAASNLTLTWPSYGIGFSAQTSSTLGTNALWSPVGGSPILNSNQWWLTLPATNNPTFIRLIR